MIDIDVIAKECEQMIGDGLDFLSPKSCNNASQIAELVVMLRDAQEFKRLYIDSIDGEVDVITDEIRIAMTSKACGVVAKGAK